MNVKYLLNLLALLLYTHHANSQINVSESANYTRADTLRGTLSPLRSCYDVLFYELKIKIDIENKFISGTNQIRFFAQTDFDKIQVDLFENLEIDKIEWKGRVLDYRREFNAVFIQFPEKIKEGTTGEISIQYSGIPTIAKHAPWDGGFSWSKDKAGNEWVGVSCQGMGASSWWPCKDHQSDEPDSMKISMYVPPKYEGVSNGRLTQVVAFNDGWNQYDWYVSYPINTYDVSINIGKYKHFKETYENSKFKKPLTLDYFVLPENYKKAKKHFEQVKPMMDCYYSLFGEYPFVRDGYKLVETSYLGMEHQSCISYGNQYKSGYLGKDLSGTGVKFDYIIIHETAHEWWGNSVTTNDIADMWIHEGFATYAEALYVECREGHPAYLKYINSEKKRVKNVETIIGDYGVNKKGSNDMYSKGALMLHSIRSSIDDDQKFFSILKGIQDTFRYQTINTGDVEKYISRHAGIDFSDFFDIYLRSPKIPSLEIKLESDSIGFMMNYRYVLEDTTDIKRYENLNLPVKVTLKKDVFQFIYPTSLWKSIAVRGMKVEDFKVAEDLFYINHELIFPQKNRGKAAVEN